MRLAPLGRSLFQAATQPEATALLTGLIFQILETGVMATVRLDLDGQGQSGADHLFVEHLVAAVDIGEHAAVAVLAFLVELQPQSLAVAEIHGMHLGLRTEFLRALRGIDAYQPNLPGTALVFHQHGIAVNESQETSILRRGKHGQEQQREKQTQAHNGIAKRHRYVIYNFHGGGQSDKKIKDTSMKVTFLVDNNTLTDGYFLAEPGLSMLIEDENTRVLFDAGYSDAFLINARRKGLDLLHLDWIALSHGHIDHTWGLDALIRHYFEAEAQKQDTSRPKLLAHPQAFTTKRHRGMPEIGMLMAQEKLDCQFELTLTDQPVWLSEKLVTLGQIEHVLDFEPQASLGERMEDTPIPDDLPDDTAMAYVTDAGLVVITGCAHSGVCNTVEQAKRVTGVDTIHTVLGGFHLLNASPERLDPTTDYLAALNLKNLYACHCTDLAAKISLARKCPVREVGSGMTLKF